MKFKVGDIIRDIDGDVVRITSIDNIDNVGCTLYVEIVISPNGYSSGVRYLSHKYRFKLLGKVQKLLLDLE